MKFNSGEESGSVTNIVSTSGIIYNRPQDFYSTSYNATTDEAWLGCTFKTPTQFYVSGNTSGGFSNVHIYRIEGLK